MKDVKDWQKSLRPRVKAQILEDVLSQVSNQLPAINSEAPDIQHMTRHVIRKALKDCKVQPKNGDSKKVSRYLNHLNKP